MKVALIERLPDSLATQEPCKACRTNTNVRWLVAVLSEGGPFSAKQPKDEAGEVYLCDSCSNTQGTPQ